jgi:hypothetical protein
MIMCLGCLLLSAGCYWKSPPGQSAGPTQRPGPVITPPEPAQRDWSMPDASETAQAPPSSSSDSEGAPPMPVVSPVEPAGGPVEPSRAPESVPAETIARASDLFHDTFADVEGAIYWDRDGTKSKEGPPNLRQVYFFHAMPDGGPLVMRAVEDNVQTGPDGKPGVLALSWQQLPPKLAYSGFTFLGPRTGRMPLQPISQARSPDDLKPYCLQFRYRMINENEPERSDSGGGLRSLTVGCRLEPMLPDSYNKRLDLGSFAATGEWGTFDLPLTEGTNTEAFLKAIAEESPTAFKIVWSQAGNFADYHSGDTLLIDDIILTAATAEQR